MELIKKIVVSIFITIHITMMVTAGLPNQSAVGKEVMKTLRWYQVLFSLDQSWSMFAPNPSSKNSYLDAVITFKDGSTEKWTFPRASHLDEWPRFTSGERLRKYQQENLIPMSRNELWFDLARYLEREVDKIEATGKKRIVEQIQFYKHTSVLKSPTVQFIEHGKPITDYKSEAAFLFKSNDKVIYEAKNNN